jgi:hypothetical protein
MNAFVVSYLIAHATHIVGGVYVVLFCAVNALEPPDETSSRRYRYIYRFLNMLPIPTLRVPVVPAARFPIPKP